MNNTSIVENLVFKKLAEAISEEIDYAGIAKAVAPKFKKKIIEEANRQINEELELEPWVNEVMKNNILDEAMEAVAQHLADSMIASLKGK